MQLRHSLVIGWLYPELMSTYGDRGNIIALQKRCEWRGIQVKVERLDPGFNHEQLATCNMLFMGGAQDRQQQIVSEDLKKKADALSKMIENGTPGLYICGAYQFLGKYYKEADGTIIKGLGIFDLYTENPGEQHPRLIGNIIAETHNSLFMIHNSRATLVGFENHGGRTFLGKNIQPLATVKVGFGNNGGLPAMHDGRQVQAGDKTEGAIYKNSFGSYMHGPILPKNPHLADLLMELALEKKYGEKVKLKHTDDSLETKAREAILARF